MGVGGLTFGLICQKRMPSRLTLASAIVGAAAVLVAVVMSCVYLSIFASGIAFSVDPR